MCLTTQNIQFINELSISFEHIEHDYISIKTLSCTTSNWTPTSIRTTKLKPNKIQTCTRRK